ncbi:adenylate/guanylate cyclase domain-containing protein [Bradyrhizobium sp. CCBAU 45394]|uniref:adenylate/guanylate cyclase domain-containing protein n=1 Tax=Bradyrhizobium sp. CCBAU 45394 TaxID=1325087 RepID=UPI002303093F|nr:adenylate/guanylate cyclase domain-containing protein [Bradyrhizobium sp. CCBAU 45394]
MECPNCHSDTPDTGKFCIACGAAVEARCPFCGSANRPNAKFCAECGRPLTARASTTREAPLFAAACPIAPVAASAERRQLTVMFCDLVGSTQLSARLDPEDLRDVIGAYHRAVAEIIARFEGFVAKYMGDGVLAYFGYPRAHEHDAERAVRAGLALVEAVPRLELITECGLQVRIGIATGLVVVGDLTGSGEAQERGVVGETPNLAARLQTLAQPGMVVIAPSTRRLTGGYFDYRELGGVALKGFGEPVSAWQVVAESAVESRFEAQHEIALTPLIGREEEVELLRRRWRQAEKGEGRVVLLVGEAGIGKSRLTRALLEGLAAEPHLRLRYFCSPHHRNSALFPVISQIEHAAGFLRDNTAEQKLAKLDLLLARAAAEPEAVDLITDLLSLPARHPAPEPSPQQRKEKTLAALLAQVDGLAQEQPVLILFEDLHWIDPTSLELLTAIVDRVQRLPVLLLATARPEFMPPWPSHAHVTALSLTRLSRRECVALVEQITGGKVLPDEILEQILARTDGVALFIEELTKTVIEGDMLIDMGDRYTMAGPLPSLAIPTTLHDSLMARLDRLAPVKEVAQIAACIGRDFDYDLLAAVSGMPEDGLRSALEALRHAELVIPRGLSGELFSFKHALVRDAAYAGLLKSRRVQLHAAIARAIEQSFAHLVETEPETLAHHLTEAGLPEKAAGYWLRAGKIAASRYANIEAIAHMRRGIEAVRRFPSGATNDRLELDLQFVLGPCLIATQGVRSNAYAATVTRARELCERLGDTPEYPHVIQWSAYMHFVRAELPQALDGFTAALGLAEAAENRPAAVNAMRTVGATLLFMGRLVEGRRMLERSLAEFDMCDEAESLATRATAWDAGVAGNLQLSWTLWALGYPDMARARMGVALQRAEAIGHPHTEAYGAYYASVLHAFCRAPAVAHAHAERCLALSEEHGFELWRNRSRAVRRICANQFDPSSDSLAAVSGELAEFVGTGYQISSTALYALLSQAFLARRQLMSAREIVGKGLATAEQTSERFLEAELLRQKARALVIEGGPGVLTDAQKLLEESRALAQSQKARSLELRAAADLARLHRDQGRYAEARELLTPVYSWFTEGFDTPDLQEAKALLEELG